MLQNRKKIGMVIKTRVDGKKIYKFANVGQKWCKIFHVRIKINLS